MNFTQRYDVLKLTKSYDDSQREIKQIVNSRRSNAVIQPLVLFVFEMEVHLHLFTSVGGMMR